MTNLCQYLDASAARFPDRTAVVDPDGTTLTYRALLDRASRIAGFLVSRGVCPGDRVGLVAPKSAAGVAALFGIMKAGAAYVPADYTAPVPRNQAILSDCAVKAAFLHPGVRPVLDNWPAGEPPSTVVWMPDVSGDAASAEWDRVLAHPPLEENRLAAADELAYILYTSGSTGTPKGVMLTHRNATSFVDWCSSVFDPSDDDRVSNHAPFHFDLSILDIYVALKHGAALYLISESLGKSPQELGAFIETNKLTVWYSTPSILSALAQFGGLDRLDCRSLRLVLFAGEVFPVKHLRDIVDRWPHAAFYNLYGPTETNVCTFARIPSQIPPDRTTPYPIGQLCEHCEGMVLDVPDGHEVPEGEEGLLYISGASVFPGYWNRPGAVRFIERHGRRWYNTGDVVRETPEDGFIYLGRRDRMVKRRGYRIELGEIERGLYQHERLREAAVLAVPDAAAGVRIVAYVTPQPGARPSIVELKMFCGRQLPSYMNPDVFVVLDTLPRTSTNKVDYQALTRLAQGQLAPA